MSITHETFFRAECNHDGCKATLPNPREEEASHWPRNFLIEQLAEPRGMDNETWFYDGFDRTLCPRHKPGTTECARCGSRGYVDNTDPQYTFKYGFCADCEGRGYLLPPDEVDRITLEVGGLRAVLHPPDEDEGWLHLRPGPS